MGKMKILWCLNPFQDEPSLRERCRVLLRGLALRNATVEPVYVSSPAELQISLEFSVPIRMRYRTVATRKMDAFLKRVKGLPLRPPRILEEREAGISDAAKALADYARKEKADVLVLGTHARSGFARFMLGSYAESLLAVSRTPVILVKPRSRVSRVKKILFATDLSPASRKAFASCCRLARHSGASVVLQNVFEHPPRWITSQGYLLSGSKILTPEEYVAGLEDDRRSMARPFLKIARQARVETDLRVTVSDGPVAETILGTARTLKADMIALASQSSRLRAGLLGSVSRKTLHGSSVPVWLARSA